MNTPILQVTNSTCLPAPLNEKLYDATFQSLTLRGIVSEQVEILKDTLANFGENAIEIFFLSDKPIQLVG